MDKHLLHITVIDRVEPDPAQVTKAVVHALQMKTPLWMLGTKGSQRRLLGPDQVNKFTPENYQHMAQLGLLYTERRVPLLRVFAEEIDPQGIPKKWTPYAHAFALRSHEGQLKMNDE